MDGIKKAVLLGVPPRDAFALELLIARALPDWQCATALADSAWPAAQAYVLETTAWHAGGTGERDWKRLAARLNGAPAVLLAPPPNTRDGAEVAAQARSAGQRWRVLHRPFGAQAMNDALAWLARPPAAPATPQAPPATSARTAEDGVAAALAEPAPVPGASALFTTSVIGIGIGVDPVPAGPAAAPPPQIGEGELSLAAFRACAAQSPHEAAQRALTRLAERLAAPGAFEISLTLINGLLFDAARERVASNTPLSVLRMVCKSRALSEHARFGDLEPHVDIARRAAQRGMQVHPLGAMLYALAQVTDCPLPGD